MKIGKKLAAFAAAAVLLTASACSGGGEKKLEKLRIACEDGDYPPFEFYDESGTLVGMDVELGKKICQKMGIEYELVLTDWDGIFDGLDRGDYECVISAVTISEDRLQNYDFSVPYIQNYQCFAVKKDAEIKPASPDEISGLRVGYQESTTSEEFINSYADKKGISFSKNAYSKMLDAFYDLEAGRIDVVVCDSTVTTSYLGADAKFELSWIQKDNPEEIAICVKKGETQLVEKINSALSELKSDGEIEKLINKYF